MIDKMDTLYDKIIAAVNEESNYIDVREVALTAYDRKMFDVAEIFAEKALSINSMDKSLLILIAELALKKKDYTLALHYLSECKKYHKLETKELHNYFKVYSKHILFRRFVGSSRYAVFFRNRQ